MNWKAKDIFKLLTIVTLFLLFITFLYRIMGVISWLAAAFLITILLSPLVEWFQKYTPRKNRATAVLFTMLFVIAIVVALALIVFPPLVKELSAMISSLTSYASTVKADPTVSKLYSQVGSQASQANVGTITRDTATTIGKGISGLITGIFSGAFAIFTIVTLAFFMLLDTKKVIQGMSQYIPSKYRKLYLKLNTDLFSIVSKYFAGVIIVASIAGGAALIPLYLTHAPYALALAVTIAAFDLIPMVGATIGTIIVALVCLLSGNVTAAVVITGFIIIYQQIENNVVIPLVQKQTVKMSPLAILVALMIGGAIGGVIGTLLAIPAAAFIKVVYSAVKAEGFLPKSAEEV
jgi:predicted PurR-regulated permease PerM